MSYSDSNSSDDEYEFKDYTIERYKSGSGPPLIAKKARILAATTQNDVETLRELLDSPKWYRVYDKNGNNLLRISIFRENDEVFDFLRSLGAFHWDSMGDSYAFELKIKRSVDVNVKIDSDGNTFLHCALNRNLIKASLSLIERGADLNAQNELGRTPLHTCVDMPADLRDEAICMLLCHGADPSIPDLWDFTIFDLMVTVSGWSITTENVFYFTVDELSLYEVPVRTLMKLAHKSKSGFKQVTELASDIIYTDGVGGYFELLMTVDSECLLILLEKYPHFVKDVVQDYSEILSGSNTNLFKRFDLKNVDTLIQISSLNSDMIEIISKVNSNKLIYVCTYSANKSKKETLEIIYYFLSYGMMCLHEMDFQEIYWMAGYSEDLKNLLIIDVEEEPHSPIIEMMPRLIYDVSFDVHKYIGYNHPYGFINWNWEGILRYFAHPRVQNAYFEFLGGCGLHGKRLPKVPLLQELARDAFRKYFIEIFEIRTAKQFYTLLKALPISPIHKKIITYESRLY